MQETPTDPFAVPQSLPPWCRPTVQPAPTRRPPMMRRPTVGGLVGICIAAGLCLIVLAVPGGPDGPARIALVEFIAAVACWTGTKIDDTFIALGAALAAVGTGVVDSDVLFAAFGSEMIWLLVAAFVLSAGVAKTGLPVRLAATAFVRARSVRQLAHLVSIAMFVSAFAIPSTSGRAALAVPVFTVLASVLSDRPRVVRALAILFPTVILLTAVATILGAGAHLVTNEVLQRTTGDQIGFVEWALLGAPLALVSAVVATEIVLAAFTSREDRREPLSVSTIDFAAGVTTPVTGPLTDVERRASVILGMVVLAWCTEPLHHAHPAVVALLGALAITSPRIGTTTMSAGLQTVPWSLLVFMAATAALGVALHVSGAAEWLAAALFQPLVAAPPVVVVAAVVCVSVAAHLCIQSRTARSTVLIPLIVPLAVSTGLQPAALAFASTAAAGFCHSMTSSAKPAAMFARIEGIDGYEAPTCAACPYGWHRRWRPWAWASHCSPGRTSTSRCSEELLIR